MQPVDRENSEIGQDADADLFAHGLFDGGEIVAGEGNVGIFADLFGKPAGKTGVYGNLYKTPVFAADGFQVAFMAIDAVGKMGDAAHGKVVLGGADEAQGDVGEDRRMQVNIAVGYGGRQEIADAVRELLRERAAAGASLEEVAASLSEEDITDHLYTKGQPDPDLVIRTSGEQRLSGFLLWQSVHSEFYFCEVNWPAFRRVDFLRALRDFASRERRLGR